MSQNDSESIINEILDKQFSFDENVQFEDLYEMLSELADNPINLNSATRDELEQMHILSNLQIENLLEYRFDYGNFLSIYELLLIDNFDNETVRLCKPFFKIESIEEKQNISLKQIFKNGKNEFTGSANYTVQKKKGYIEGKYNGPPVGGYFKYKFTHKNLSMSFIAEQDAGESFFKNGGFDFYSAHVMVKDINRCKAFVIGDYKLNFGQGLVLKSNVYYGKSSDLSSIIQCQDAISSYTSTTEYGYFRGAATTWKLFENINATVFFSHTNYKDNQNYHRTDSELANKNSDKRNVSGGNINYEHTRFKIGFTSVYDQTSRKLNAGIDYRTRIHKFNLAGEIALNEKMKIATLHSVSFSPVNQISITALFRYYDPEYECRFGNAYSESKLNDETGLLFGINFKPARYWIFSMSADVFRFKKPKYGISMPSDGFKISGDISYNPSGKLSIYAKYDLKSKEKDLKIPDRKEKNVERYEKHQVKLVYYSKLTDYIEMDGGWIGSFHCMTKINTGNVLYQGIKINMAKQGLKIAGGLSFFDVGNYDNRIYLYESGLPYTYSSTMYYGQGCRAHIVLKYNTPKKFFSINLKAAHTFYSEQNRTEISSGNETINGNRKTDIRFMAVLKF